jgi:hypothetical protein
LDKEIEKKVIEEHIVNREQAILIESATQNLKEQTILMNKMYEKLWESQ